MLRFNAILGITYNLAILVGLNCHWGRNGIPGERSKDGLISFCIIKEILELSLLTLLLINVRPRDWPRFFSIDMGPDQAEFFEELDPLGRRLNQPPLFTTEYCEASIHASSFDRMTKSNRSSFDLGSDSSSIQSDDSIQPIQNQYNNRRERHDRRSPYVIVNPVEHDEIAFKSRVMSSAFIGYKE